VSVVRSADEDYYWWPVTGMCRKPRGQSEVADKVSRVYLGEEGAEICGIDDEEGGGCEGRQNQSNSYIYVWCQVLR
jgi:hypothetical protein